MKLAEKLPNPFEACDIAKDQLEQCQNEIADMKKTIALLVEGQTFLLNLCNRKNKANAEK